MAVGLTSGRAGVVVSLMEGISGRWSMERSQRNWVTHAEIQALSKKASSMGFQGHLEHQHRISSPLARVQPQRPMLKTATDLDLLALGGNLVLGDPTSCHSMHCFHLIPIPLVPGSHGWLSGSHPL